MTTEINRRGFLLGAAGATLGATPAGVCGQDPSGGRPAGKAPRKAAGPATSAVVSIDGRTFTFNEADGENLGDFEGPGFVQRCIRVTRPDIPLTVFFRPDRDSDRSEVVFELGRLWGEANAEAANLGEYRVGILREGTTLARVEVPRHWWFSSWRWQSAPRPVIRSPERLIRAKLLLPFGRRAARDAAPTRPVRYAGPMDSAGVCKAMPMVGERPDIGPVTEWQAECIVTRSRAALASLLAQAEAAGSVPWHMRDELTGAPVNIYEHPKVNWYYQPLPGTEHVRTTKTEWKVDDAHQPALAYVPYLLTGDPYYLEKLQFQGTYNVGWTPYHRTIQRLPVLYPGETRAYAWGLRTLAQLARVTPEHTPRWLLPRSYWKRMLDDNLTYFTREFVDSPDPASAIFRAATRQDLVASWMECYLAVAIGWAVLLGFEEWRRVFEWKIGSTIALTNGKSGWPRQWCSPYYYKLRSSPDGPVPRSWGELWAAFKADSANKVQPFPDRASWAQPNSFGYVFYTRAALALATHLGVAEARQCLAFVDAMTVDGLRKGRGPMSFRWAIEEA